MGRVFRVFWLLAIDMWTLAEETGRTMCDVLGLNSVPVDSGPCVAVDMVDAELSLLSCCRKFLASGWDVGFPRAFACNHIRFSIILFGDYSGHSCIYLLQGECTADRSPASFLRVAVWVCVSSRFSFP